jgi:hypothetical protein
MPNNSEFIFLRPVQSQPKKYQGTVQEFESFVDSCSLQKPSPELAGAADTAIAELIQRLGVATTEMIAHWGGIVVQVHRGQVVDHEQLLYAIQLAVRFSENAKVTKHATPETNLLALLIESAEYVHNHASDTKQKLLAFICAEHIRLLAEANSGSVVYRDPYLLISWRSAFKRERPELYVCVRCLRTGAFTYVPQFLVGDTNVTPPISSFRAARQAIRNWKGQSIGGDLLSSASIRLCEALGIEIQGTRGVIRRASGRLTGFGRSLSFGR